MAINKDLQKRLNMKQITEIKKSWWMQLGIFVKKWIYKDMLAGKLQGKEVKYKSGKKGGESSYVKYKKKYMRKKDGKILKGITAPPKSKHTANVNMVLTGTLGEGLHPLKATKNGLTMSYAPKDRMKIVGNKEAGDSIKTLNTKNTKKVKTKLEEQYNKNIDAWAKKKIIINVGK